MSGLPFLTSGIQFRQIIQGFRLSPFHTSLALGETGGRRTAFGLFFHGGTQFLSGRRTFLLQVIQIKERGPIRLGHGQERKGIQCRAKNIRNARENPSLGGLFRQLCAHSLLDGGLL